MTKPFSISDVAKQDPDEPVEDGGEVVLGDLPVPKPPRNEIVEVRRSGHTNARFHVPPSALLTIVWCIGFLGVLFRCLWDADMDLLGDFMAFTGAGAFGWMLGSQRERGSSSVTSSTKNEGVDSS